jgi:hypothetical protein
MTAFFWSIGPAQGSLQTMILTIVGEVGFLEVTSSALSGGVQVPVSNFQPCIMASQNIECVAPRSILNRLDERAA